MRIQQMTTAREYAKCVTEDAMYTKSSGIQKLSGKDIAVRWISGESNTAPSGQLKKLSG